MIAINKFQLEIARKLSTDGRLARPHRSDEKNPLQPRHDSVDQSLGKNPRCYENQGFRFCRLVVGVLEDKNRDILSRIGADDYDINKRILIPYTLYQQQFGVKDIHTLQAEAINVDKIEDATNELIELLSRRHNNRYKYTSESMKSWIETAENVLNNISLVGLVAASISLFVGR